MSTLRETVGQVIAEMTTCPVAFPPTLKDWANELTAALQADTAASCRCPSDVLDACDDWGFDTLGEGDRCTICGRKVQVPK